MTTLFDPQCVPPQAGGTRWVDVPPLLSPGRTRTCRPLHGGARLHAGPCPTLAPPASGSEQRPRARPDLWTGGPRKRDRRSAESGPACGESPGRRRDWGPGWGGFMSCGARLPSRCGPTVTADPSLAITPRFHLACLPLFPRCALCCQWTRSLGPGTCCFSHWSRGTCTLLRTRTLMRWPVTPPRVAGRRGGRCRPRSRDGRVSLGRVAAVGSCVWARSRLVCLSARRASLRACVGPWGKRRLHNCLRLPRAAARSPRPAHWRGGGCVGKGLGLRGSVGGLLSPCPVPSSPSPVLASVCLLARVAGQQGGSLHWCGAVGGVAGCQGRLCGSTGLASGTLKPR